MLAQRRSYLYLGGMLSSMLTLLAIGNLFNYFFRSHAMYTTNLVRSSPIWKCSWPFSYGVCGVICSTSVSRCFAATSCSTRK
jgi:hypothetical protein